MSLLDRLKPRWRRSDPEERLAAVRDMGARDQGRLASLAGGDPEARVRRAAIKRLDDTEALDRVAAHDPDSALRAAAAERAVEVRVRSAAGDGALAACRAALAELEDERALTAVALSAAHAEIRGAAADRVAAERALREIVEGSGDRDVAAAALARIADDATLRAIAVGEAPAELALAALERIADVATLRAIAHGKAGAKAVRRRASARLPAGDDARPAIDVERARVRQNELAASIQAVRAMPDVARAAERAREADLEWQALARVVEPKPELVARFVPVCRAVLEDGVRAARDRAERDEARARRDAALAARRELCARVEALAGAEAPQAIAAATSDWQRLAPLAADQAEEGAALERRFRAACEARREEHERSRQRAARAADLRAIVEEAEALLERGPARGTDAWRRIEKRWADAAASRESAPDAEALAQRFAAAAEGLRRRQEEAQALRRAAEEENRARLDALLARLQALIEAESPRLATARQELRAAEAALADLGPLPPAERRGAWKERLGELRAQLLRRLAALEEAEGWRRWANAGAQEDIIARAEGLRTSEDLPALGARLKELQDEWARSATASPDRAQALWERFRGVRDELRARVDAYLAANLERKRALCASVAAVGDSTEWKETAELIKRAQAEWKEIGPVPARQSQEIWRRFREPCDRFFARRKEHFDRIDEKRRGNAERQAELCARAEALRDSTDWEPTAAALKDLQAEWKQSGPAPRDQADELWARFRAACDGFFDRFHRRDALEREQAIEQARAICEQLEALAADAGGDPTPAPEDLRARLDEGLGGWARLDLGAVAAAAPLRARIDGACLRLAAAAPEALSGSRIDPAVTARRRERLCERVEALAAAARPGAAASAQLSLQEQVLALRERIATNTIVKDDVTAASRGAAEREEVATIRLRWTALGPALDEEARLLEQRFDAALARLTGKGGAGVA